MTSPEADPYLQRIVDVANAQLHQRLQDACPIESLSTRNGKTLEVVTEVDGSKLVKRSYSEQGVNRIEWQGLPFVDAWREMNAMFTHAGIEVVPSQLLETVDGNPCTIISEYLEEVVPLGSASTEAKQDLATKLGRLLKAETGFIPAPEMLNAGMFSATELEDGLWRLCLIDVDPYILEERWNGDVIKANFITRLSELFWDEWCSEAERESVIRSLVISIGDSIDDADFGADRRTGMAFANMHLMTQGLDPRQCGIPVGR